MLICHRYKSAYLINTETNQIIQEYQSNQRKDEEFIYASFSTGFNYVYAFSSAKNLYIFDKSNGKLVSLILIPIDEIEIHGIISTLDKRINQESLIIYSYSNLFRFGDKDWLTN